MTSRRKTLKNIAAAFVLCPAPSWADAGAPEYLAAGRRVDGSFTLCGMRANGEIAFALPLPDRGHAAAAHPLRPEAVAFARRPGTFAMVLDCRNGDLLVPLQAPVDHHFYGHGAFSADGSVLYTTENAYETGEGRIGLWDTRAGYARIGDIPSHGIGPHDVLRLPGQETLAIANGGIETHPASGRAKLNLPVMRPNLSYVTPTGDLLEQVAPPDAWHLNSLRHLAVRADGMIAAAAQWQGDPVEAPPLLALHRRGQALNWHAVEGPAHGQLRGYAGSVAFSEAGDAVAITSPRGGVIQRFGLGRDATPQSHALVDACGIAPGPGGFLATAGTGGVATLGRIAGLSPLGRHRLAWDNHLVAIRAPV